MQSYTLCTVQGLVAGRIPLVDLDDDHQFHVTPGLNKVTKEKLPQKSSSSPKPLQRKTREPSPSPTKPVLLTKSRCPAAQSIAYVLASKRGEVLLASVGCPER